MQTLVGKKKTRKVRSKSDSDICTVEKPGVVKVGIAAVDSISSSDNDR